MVRWSLVPSIARCGAAQRSACWLLLGPMVRCGPVKWSLTLYLGCVCFFPDLGSRYGNRARRTTRTTPFCASRNTRLIRKSTRLNSRCAAVRCLRSLCVMAIGQYEDVQESIQGAQLSDGCDAVDEVRHDRAMECGKRHGRCACISTPFGGPANCCLTGWMDGWMDGWMSSE